MAGLASLVDLLRVLSPEEIDTTDKYLKCFHRRGDHHASVKLVKLFTVLVKHLDQPLSENEIMYLVYGQSKALALDKLILRLRDKVLDVLLLEINVKREGVYADRSKAIFEIRNRISAGTTMLSRGKAEIALYLLNYAIDEAKKYEYYDELLIAQKFIMQSSALRKGIKEHNRQMDIFKSFQFCREAAERAEFAYNEFCVRDAFTAEGESTMLWLQKTIREINKDYAATQSATVRYYQYYLEAHFYERQKNFRKQGRVIRNLIELLDTRTAVFSKQRKSIALINLAFCDIKLLNFSEAINHCIEAEALQQADNFNMAQSREFRSIAYYYCGEFAKAEELLDEILNSSYSKQSGEFHTGRRLYYKACCCFMQRKYNDALKILNEINPIEKDAEGWNVAVRLMLIITLIEVINHDSASSHTKSLYFHLHRLQKEKELHPRTKLIASLFYKLEKNGFQFQPTYQEAKEKFDSLFDNTPETGWQTLTPEMVPIHKWFYTKIFRQPLFPFTKKAIVTKQLSQNTHE